MNKIDKQKMDILRSGSALWWLFMVILVVNQFQSTATIAIGKNSSDIISVQALKQKLQQGDDVTLIDVRMPWEIKRFGKIAQSVNIPLSQIQTAFTLNGTEFKTSYKIDKPSIDDCNLVFQCRSGVRSLKAVHIVKGLGYKCPKSLDGGFIAWSKLYEKK